MSEEFKSIEQHRIREKHASINKIMAEANELASKIESDINDRKKRSLRLIKFISCMIGTVVAIAVFVFIKR